MHYLHTLEPPVLHRNLKTQNLLLDEGGRVKICNPNLNLDPDPNPNLNPNPTLTLTLTLTLGALRSATLDGRALRRSTRARLSSTAGR